jgi:hypothetical protein
VASPAAAKYMQLSAAASTILEVSRKHSGRERLRTLYGAAFVAEVAGWNAYTTDLVRCFFTSVASPLTPHFHAMHSLANTAARLKLDRFTTPNAENARNLVLECTGYDPWPDWQWAARRMHGLAVRARLNEILKVRHSFAHGFAIPGYSWTQSPSGLTRLTLGSVKWTQDFLRHLVMTTDRGLKAHIQTVHGVAVPW